MAPIAASIGAAGGRARLVRARPLPLPAVALSLLLLVLAAVLPAGVLAHAGTVGSSPGDGERLEVAPAALVIDFTEAVGISPDGVRLVDAAGAQITLEPPTRAGTRVTQPLPPLADGWYLATWAVVSEDGHVVHGAAAFAIGAVDGPAPDAAGGAATAVTLATAVARGVADLGLVAALGALFAVLVLGAASKRTVRLASAAAVVGAAGSLVLAAIVLADAGIAAATSGTVPAALARAASLAALAAAAVLGRPRVAILPAVVALAAAVPGGHPGADPRTAALLVAHLGAAATWLGATPAVALFLADAGTSDDRAQAAVRRFSAAATVSLGVVVLGGAMLAVLLAGATLDGLDARWAALLGVKVVLVAIAALLGARTRRALGRGPVPRPRLRRVFTFDAVVLAVVIAASAGLTTGAPTENHAADDDGVHLGHCSVEAADGFVDVTFVPATVGANTVYLDGAGELAAAGVELRYGDDQGAIETELAPNGAGWRGGIAVPVAGSWVVTVVLGHDEFYVERLTCAVAFGS